MPVGHALLTASFDDTNATTFATASVTAHASKLITIAIMSSRSTAATQTPTVTGFGKTFVSVGNITFNTTSTPRSRISIFRTLLASDQTDAVDITFANSHDGIAWALREWDAVDTGGDDGANAVVQFATDRGNGGVTQTVAVPSVVGGNAVYAAIGKDTTNTETASGAYSGLTTQDMTAPAHQLFDMWDVAGSSPATATCAGADWGIIAIEIKAAAAAGSVVPILMPQYRARWTP